MNRIPNYITAFVFFLATIIFNMVQAQTCDAKDLDGMWECNIGVCINILGTDLFAEGSKA
jgi:hypothetical protein